MVFGIAALKRQRNLLWGPPQSQEKQQQVPQDAICVLLWSWLCAASMHQALALGVLGAIALMPVAIAQYLLADGTR